MTFNCAFTIAFAVPGCKQKDGDDVTAEQLRDALIKRVNDCYEAGEMVEAVGLAYDAYDEDENAEA